MKTIDKARVYRFGGTVALNVGDDEGYEPTIYIGMEVAIELVKLLHNAAMDIRVQPLFSRSELGTQVVWYISEDVMPVVEKE